MSVVPLYSLMWPSEILQWAWRCLDTSQVQSGRNTASFTQSCTKIINLFSPDCSASAAILALIFASLGNYTVLHCKFTHSIWLQGNCRHLPFQHTSKCHSTEAISTLLIVSGAFTGNYKIGHQCFLYFIVFVFRNLHFNELKFCDTLQDIT